MIRYIGDAQTARDIIEIIHPKLVEKIPANDLEKIAQNIMMGEKYFKGEVFMRPEELIATRVYSDTINQITQIDYNGQSYKVVES